MPYVSVTDYHKHPASILSDQLVKLRPALSKLDDPAGCTLIDYGSGGVFALGDLETIGGLFAPYVRLAGLHAPDGSAILINADAIAAISVDDQYAGSSVAVVKPQFNNPRVLERNKIALREDVATAQAALDGATV